MTETILTKTTAEQRDLIDQFERAHSDFLIKYEVFLDDNDGVFETIPNATPLIGRVNALASTMRDEVLPVLAQRGDGDLDGVCAVQLRSQGFEGFDLAFILTWMALWGTISAQNANDLDIAMQNLRQSGGFLYLYADENVDH
jgi:hypothetical protein